MAEDYDQSDSKELGQDKLVEHLVTDPSQVPDIKMLSGFIGKSGRDGWLRLYLTPELNEYVEISQEEIIHHRRLDTSETSLGGTVVWVRRGTNLVHTRTVSREVQAGFLQGDITAAFLNGVSAGPTLGFRGAGRLALPATFSVTQCATCPTERGEHTCFPAVCTLATSCFTTHPVDKGCGGGGVVVFF
jgi:hypothetical protein